MTRREIMTIIEKQELTSQNNYQKLKACLGCPYDIDKIDKWFEGLVSSVQVWKPNTKMLVLLGKQELGKMDFFNYLLPDELQLAFLSTANINEDMIYDRMIVDIPMRKSILSFIKEYQFITRTINGQITAFKRMSSICTTANEWHYPQRKNVIVIKLKSIDWELYNSIDKMQLWVEIFKMFGTTKSNQILSHEKINRIS